MTLCHNCGFELAEPTGFCPMCGVAQEPSALSSAVEDTEAEMSRLFGVEGVEEPESSDEELRAEAPAVMVDPNEPTDPAIAPVESGAFEEPSDVAEDHDQPLLAEAEPPQVEESEEPSLLEAAEPKEEPTAAPVTDDFSNDSDAYLNDETPSAVTDDELRLVEPEGDPQPGEKADTNDFVNGQSEADEQPPGAALTAHSMSSGTKDAKRGGLKPLGEGTLLNNRYRIVRKIGGGGMGAVYLACDQNLGDIERAVKEMVQSSIEEDQQNKAVEDFKRESTILSTLDHPAIPTIYDYFFDDSEGRFYLVMKYIPGGDLASRLRATPGGRIDERTVTEWAIQVADVLAYLHSLPTTIVYRDLKPSNIMLDAAGRVMLIDFGIARSINQEVKGVTAVGTMGYAPPELFSGQVEPRSDIYSLGSTMFHLLTGADPQNNPLLIFDFQKNPRPRQINPQLSDQMERLLMRAVEYNAETRFPSADAMRDALVDHLERLRTGQITFGVSEVPEVVSLANQFVFCGFCGQQIVATDLFCAFCGAKQPIAQQGVHAEIYPRTGVTAKLVVDGTSELDTPVFALEKNENLLGRRDPQSNIFPEVDLSKFDPQTKISRRHARIWREGGGFMIEDLGSSNGTILLAGINNAVHLQPRQPHPLASGDRLRLGDTTLHFVMS